MKFSIENLSCGYKGHALIKDITTSISNGEVICILGPNGVGKTTFFKTIQGFLPAISGSVKINGKNISDINYKELARYIAYVPQAKSQPFDYSVMDMILMGRASYIKNFTSPSRHDYDICDEIMKELKIEYMRNLSYAQISGGEQQMVLIARALAQQPELLMMDEPASNLDFGNQVKVLCQIKKLANHRIAILMITHSPDHALACADKVILFQRSADVIIGTPDEVVTEQNLMNAYGVQVRIKNFREEDYTINTCVPIISI